jgi:hypothetical protein
MDRCHSRNSRPRNEFNSYPLGDQTGEPAQLDLLLGTVTCVDGESGL